MEIVWDPNIAATNLKKHGVSFEEAATALLDPMALAHEDEDSDEEPTINGDQWGQINGVRAIDFVSIIGRRLQGHSGGCILSAYGNRLGSEQSCDEPEKHGVSF